MLNIHYIFVITIMRSVSVVMFRVLCVLLGLGLVVNCALGISVAVSDSGAKKHSPAYSYRAPVASPPDASPASGRGTETAASHARTALADQGPTMVAPNQMETLLKPSSFLTSVGNLPSNPQPNPPAQMETRLEPSQPLRSQGNSPGNDNPTGEYLDIEVNYYGFTLDLYSNSPDGRRQKLCKQKRVALGAAGFDTPAGAYYVTHIYLDKPWWIPPKNRAWAAGDSPSQKVYGGTMAPLLKKRPVRQKKQAQTPPDLEDAIENEVRLDDDGYRFHGTNAKRSIGSRASHGCVRMLPEDAKEVANLIVDRVGVAGEGSAENGVYTILKAPVRLNIVKQKPGT